MSKTRTALSLSLALAFGLAAGQAALAQTAAPATPAPDASTAPATPAPGATAPEMGQPAAGANADSDVGKPYVKAKSGDWDVRCIHSKDGHDPCQLYQLLKDENNNAVAEFSLFDLPGGQKAVAGATILTPLETLLTDPLTMQIDQSPAKSYPFTFCAPRGCVVRAGFTQEEVDAMKKGSAITVTLVPVAAPDQTVKLSISLKGFTDGYTQVAKLNAVTRAAEDKAAAPAKKK